jgi:hypothetical protein
MSSERLAPAARSSEDDAESPQPFATPAVSDGYPLEPNEEEALRRLTEEDTDGGAP